MKSIADLPVEGKRVFLRVDFNVPLDGDRVTDSTRIVETLPTIRHAIDRGARVVCASHLGKPKGKPKPELSLGPVAVELARLLQRPVRFAEDCVGPEIEDLAAKLEPGDVLLLENLRFHGGEESNDPEFARSLAALADVYVNDAFGSSHRAHASVTGVPALVAAKGAGFLLEKEVRELSRLLEPERPFAAILG
ncbi:MAG TPA: phosphoglycerate kinase, partial [Thermoanaerobaculia bacterium]|nr:phosphoglycerate kinase [Thermoanaerobaculia bacterium]